MNSAFFARFMQNLNAARVGKTNETISDLPGTQPSVKRDRAFTNFSKLPFLRSVKRAIRIYGALIVLRVPRSPTASLQRRVSG